MKFINSLVSIIKTLANFKSNPESNVDSFTYIVK